MNNFFVIKFKTILHILLFLTLLSLLFIFSKSNVETIKYTTNLFIYSVFPSLFTFAFFTEFVLNTDILYVISQKLKNVITKIFPVSAYSTFAIIIGFLCGFPGGAKAIIKLYENKKITYSEAKILLSFNNNCSPIFIFVTVGISFFNNKNIGLLLLLSHFLASIIIGIVSSFLYTSNIIHENSHFLKRIEEKNTINNKKISIFDNIKISLKNSFLILFNIFGFMLIFSLISDNIKILLDNLINNQDITNLITSIFEVTSGIKKVLLTSFNLDVKILLASILLGFSGICVIFQIYSIIYDKGFTLKYLIFTKIIHALVSFLICFIFLKLNIFNIYETKNVFYNLDIVSITNNYSMLKKIIISFYLLLFLISTNILFRDFISKKTKKDS